MFVSHRYTTKYFLAMYFVFPSPSDAGARERQGYDKIAPFGSPMDGFKAMLDMAILGVRFSTTINDETILMIDEFTWWQSLNIVVFVYFQAMFAIMCSTGPHTHTVHSHAVHSRSVHC